MLPVNKNQAFGHEDSPKCIGAAVTKTFLYAWLISVCVSFSLVSVSPKNTVVLNSFHLIVY